MKQINSTNGKVVVINKIGIQTNSVVYSIYEFGDKNMRISQYWYKFTNIQLSHYLTETVNYFDLVSEQLILEKETDFIYSEDLQNWTIGTGSTGEATTVRVYIPASLINKEVNTGSNFDLLMKEMSPLSAFVQRSQYGSMQYLEELLEPALSILQSYADSGVIIETKI